MVNVKRENLGVQLKRIVLIKESNKVERQAFAVSEREDLWYVIELQVFKK